jgi:DNA repair protein RadD
MKPIHENRAYQDEMENAVIDYLFSEEGNPVVAAPGGCGKSHVMAKLTKRFVTEWPGTRVMLLAQDGKLLTQNSNELLRMWPGAPIGIYSSGLKSRDTRQRIIFGGIQSVAKRAKEFGEFHIVLVDECDQVSPKEETLYQKFFAELREVNPKLKIVGFTATPFRLGMGCLTNFDLWDKIVIDLTKTERFQWFIENGYLSPLISKRPKAEIDITNIKMRGGEFDEKEMQEAADTDELNRAVVEECLLYGEDRKHWLVFASGVKHGHKLAKLFMARGVAAVMLSGEDTVAYRDEMEDKFRSGEIRCLVNVGLYGRGWDFPALDMIAWARATQSTALWVQGNVRLTRRASGKTNGLVLDFAGNIKRLGPVDDPIIPAPRRKGQEGGGEAPVKECPECRSYLHTRVVICPDCGYAFPPPSTIKKTASEEAIMSRASLPLEERTEEFNVFGVRYKPTLSKNNNYYLKVTYAFGTHRLSECLMFDSSAIYQKKKCSAWWVYHGGSLPVPEGTDEAADRTAELKTPTLVRVDMGPQPPEILGTIFEESDDPF